MLLTARHKMPLKSYATLLIWVGRVNSFPISILTILVYVYCMLYLLHVTSVSLNQHWKKYYKQLLVHHENEEKTIFTYVPAQRNFVHTRST